MGRGQGIRSHHYLHNGAMTAMTLDTLSCRKTESTDFFVITVERINYSIL